MNDDSNLESALPAGGIDVLSGLLGRLQTSFDATVLEVRDELDGSIVVDVRMDAGQALRVYRTRIRASAHDEFARAALLLETSASLVLQATHLVEDLRTAMDDCKTMLSSVQSMLTAIRGGREARVRTNPGANPGSFARRRS